MTILNLADIHSGKFLVTTQHGTTHVLDLDNSTVTRQGASGRAWDGSNGAGADGVPFRFLIVAAWNGPELRDWSGSPCVGKRMYVSNMKAWRLTSNIVSIDAVEE
jgi:hypothetical protein